MRAQPHTRTEPHRPPPNLSSSNSPASSALTLSSKPVTGGIPSATENNKTGIISSMSDDRERHLLDVEQLVEESRRALERANGLLAAAMQERSRGEIPEPGAPAPAQSCACSPICPSESQVREEPWLTLDRLARVEVTSESQTDLIGSALSGNSGAGWRSKETGEQTIRLVFNDPQSVHRILLEFRENEMERTQEFLLRWLPEGATDYREVVRQQYVFSPSGSTREVEDYHVELESLVSLELCIKPDISGREAFASLVKWRIG